MPSCGTWKRSASTVHRGCSAPMPWVAKCSATSPRRGDRPLPAIFGRKVRWMDQNAAALIQPAPPQDS
jgi:hypothetical protein